MNVEVRGLELLDETNKKLFQKTIKKLEKKCPLNKDLVIMISPLKDDYGRMWVSNGKFRMELRPFTCKSCMKDTLVHEWAHMMRYDSIPHKDSWGICFAKCYRATSR